MSLNRVVLTGNVTRDPEIRLTTNGTQVMNFSVAVNDRRRNQHTGEWEERPSFIDCVLFGQRADSLSRILRKGFKLAIEGKLRQNVWEVEGQRRSRIEVVVDDLDFMSRRDGAPTPATPQFSPPPAPQPSYDTQANQSDVPF